MDSTSDPSDELYNDGSQVGPSLFPEHSRILLIIVEHLLIHRPTLNRSAAEQVLSEYIFPLPSLASSSSTSTSARRADKSSENVASGSKTVHGGAGGDVDEVAWTDRLLLIMRFLDESAVGVLLNFSGIKTAYVLFSPSLSPLCA